MAMNGRIQIVDDVSTAFAELVAQAFANRANADAFSIAFSGGSSATPCYEALIPTAIDWSIVTAVWGDERLVPLDHPDSNYLATKRALFDKVDPLRVVHPMTTDIGADGYDAIVRDIAPIDVIHLGMGPDGHTASLFPESPALHAPEDQFVVETGDDLHDHPRMTLTYAGLAASRLIIFTISGEKKREMFRRIKAGEDFPAAHVKAPNIVWLVDPAAAS
jgi:6-phosphogluconolactonase